VRVSWVNASQVGLSRPRVRSATDPTSHGLHLKVCICLSIRSIVVCVLGVLFSVGVCVYGLLIFFPDQRTLSLG